MLHDSRSTVSEAAVILITTKHPGAQGVLLGQGCRPEEDWPHRFPGPGRVRHCRAAPSSRQGKPFPLWASGPPPSPSYTGPTDKEMRE